MGIVEDEPMMRSMLEQTLSGTARFRVVHAVQGVDEAKLVFTPGSCDVALLDVNLADGNGVALGLALQRDDPRLAVMLLSGEDVMGLFTLVKDQMTKPWSYLSKRSTFTRDVLVRAVEAAAAGRVVIDPYLVQQSAPRGGSLLASLTRAQLSVLRLVAEGLSNQGIAARLGINERSVESHLQSIYHRLGVHGEGQNRRVAAVLTFLDQTGRSWR